MWGDGRLPTNCLPTSGTIISAMYSSTIDAICIIFQHHWVKQFSLSTPLFVKTGVMRVMNVYITDWKPSYLIVGDEIWYTEILKGIPHKLFVTNSHETLGGIYNCLGIFFLGDRKLLKVMEGEIVAKMLCSAPPPCNFSVNPPPFVFPSVSLHQLVPGMTQQKVWRSATLSICSCRAPPTGRPGKGGRLYGNQWFSLHSPYLVPV